MMAQSPNGERICAGGNWRRSCRLLAGPIAGRSGRTPFVSHRLTDSHLLPAVLCFDGVSSVALYRSVPEHPSHRRCCINYPREPRQHMVRGSVYTATHLVRDYTSEEQFALLAAVRAWALVSLKQSADSTAVPAQVFPP